MFGTDRRSPQGLVTPRLRREPTAHGRTSARQLWQLFCCCPQRQRCLCSGPQRGSLPGADKQGIQVPPRVNSHNHHGTLGEVGPVMLVRLRKTSNLRRDLLQTFWTTTKQSMNLLPLPGIANVPSGRNEPFFLSVCLSVYLALPSGANTSSGH